MMSKLIIFMMREKKKTLEKHNIMRLVFRKYETLDHKTSHKVHEYIRGNSQKYIGWVKILHF